LFKSNCWLKYLSHQCISVTFSLAGPVWPLQLFLVVLVHLVTISLKISWPTQFTFHSDIMWYHLVMFHQCWNSSQQLVHLNERIRKRACMCFSVQYNVSLRTDVTFPSFLCCNSSLRQKSNKCEWSANYSLVTSSNI